MASLYSVDVSVLETCEDSDEILLRLPMTSDVEYMKQVEILSREISDVMLDATSHGIGRQIEVHIYTCSFHLPISDTQSALSPDALDGVELEVRRGLGNDSVGVGFGVASVVEPRRSSSVVDDFEHWRSTGAHAGHRRAGARRSRRRVGPFQRRPRILARRRS